MNNKENTELPKPAVQAGHLEHIVSHLFAVVYEDDGPSDICGQSLSITCAWHKLYLFETEETMKSFIKEVYEKKSRKNARITSIFNPQPLSDEVNFISG